MRITRHRARHGFTMIELLVAAALTLLVLGVGTQALTSTKKALDNASANATIDRLATNALERARILKCGQTPDPSSPVATTSSTRCAAEKLAEGINSSAIVEPGTYATSSYDLTMSTAWSLRDVSASPEAVSPPDTTSACAIDVTNASALSAWTKPNLFIRTVALTNRKTSLVSQTHRSITAVDTRAIAGLGGVLVDLGTAAATDKATVTSSFGSATTRQVSPACVGSRSTLLFPYLPTGTAYTVTVQHNGSVFSRTVAVNPSVLSVVS